MIDESKKVEYINFVSDAYFNRDITTFMDYYGKYYNELYLFRLSYSSEINTRIMKTLDIQGTTHGDLLQYIFYRKKKYDSANDKDKEIMSILNETICNFVKTGFVLLFSYTTTLSNLIFLFLALRFKLLFLIIGVILFPVLM